MSKQYAEKDHDHPWLVRGAVFGAISLLLLFGLTFTLNNMNDRIDLLENEIASMPHYECWNESFNGFVNMSEMDYCIYGHFVGYKEGETCSGWYNDYRAECDLKSRICYIDDVKEVCMLNKFLLSEDSE